MNDLSHGTCIGYIYFPIPYLYDEAYFMSNSVFFGSSPWLNRDFPHNDLLVNRYVTDEWLPGGVPVSILRLWCWCFQFACRNLYMFITPCTPPDVVCCLFARRAIDLFNHLNTYIANTTAQYGMFMYSTSGA